MGHQHQQGMAVVEMAIISLLLIVMLLAVIDFGRAILVRQVMINLSRETSSLASRGTPMNDAVEAARASASPLSIDNSGYVILSEVVRDGEGNASVVEQVAVGGVAQASRVGTSSGPADLPATDPPVPQAGQSLFVTEVFYNNQSITPLGNLVGVALNSVYYDVAYF